MQDKEIEAGAMREINAVAMMECRRMQTETLV